MDGRRRKTNNKHPTHTQPPGRVMCLKYNMAGKEHRQSLERESGQIIRERSTTRHDIRGNSVSNRVTTIKLLGEQAQHGRPLTSWCFSIIIGDMLLCP